MNTFSLPPQVTHDETPLVLESFKKALPTLSVSGAARDGGSKAMQVDARELKIFNSSALALLLAFKRELQGLGLEMQVLNLPEQLQNLAKVYGVEQFLIPA